MPFVYGFLRRARRRPGGGAGPVDPDYGIDEGVDPGYGIDEGAGIDNELPEVDPPSIWPSPGRPSHPIYLPRPRPPVGIWPPPTPEHPIVPVPEPPPSVGGGPIVPPGGPGIPGRPIDPDARPEHPIYQPGTIWPPPNASGKFIVLAWIPGMGWKYIVVDASLKPTHPIAPGGTSEPRR